jgi:ketosteroid isomerase-like protein
MRTILMIAAFVFASATCASGQATSKAAEDQSSNSAEQAVLKVTNEWLDAEGRNDRAALDRIIAEEFIGTSPMGNAITKKDVVPTGNARAGGLSMSAQDLKARVFGDTAVVTGRGLPKGRETDEVRFTIVLVKRASGWQLVAGHISPLPREEE